MDFFTDSNYNPQTDTTTFELTKVPICIANGLRRTLLTGIPVIAFDENPKSIKIATLLYKPAAYTKKHPIDYVGLEIPNAFVVGYGLDYDGLGRSLSSIYVLNE